MGMSPSVLFWPFSCAGGYRASTPAYAGKGKDSEKNLQNKIAETLPQFLQKVAEVFRQFLKFYK